MCRVSWINCLLCSDHEYNCPPYNYVIRFYSKSNDMDKLFLSNMIFMLLKIWLKIRDFCHQGPLRYLFREIKWKKLLTLCFLLVKNLILIRVYPLKQMQSWPIPQHMVCFHVTYIFYNMVGLIFAIYFVTISVQLKSQCYRGVGAAMFKY